MHRLKGATAPDCGENHSEQEAPAMAPLQPLTDTEWLDFNFFPIPIYGTCHDMDENETLAEMQRYAKFVMWCAGFED